MVTNLRLKVVEVVGLHQGNDGRTCLNHPVCGLSVKKGDQLIFKNSLLTQLVTTVRFIPDQTAVPPEGAFVKKTVGRPKKVKMVETEVLEEVTTPVVKVNKWENGVSTCLVAFVSKAFISIYGADSLDGRVVEVTDLLNESEYETDRIRSRSMNGLCRVTVLL